MTRRRVLIAGAVAALAILALVIAWPSLVHRLVIARIHALTHRPVSVEAVHLNPLTGRLIVQGLRVHERDGESLFTGFERLEIHFNPLSLLDRHLRIHEARLEAPTTRIVRLPEGFNISDLTEGSGPPRRWLDVTVTHLVVTRGLATLEDRALAEPRTWTSEGIEIEAHDLSTRRDDGRATARSVTEGAPVSLELRRMRLYPIHLEAVATASNVDLSPARLYLPRDAALVLDRGRATSTLTVTLDARDGLSAHATAEIVDAVMRRPGERDPALEVPRLTLELADLRYQKERLEVGRFELAGAASVKDPRAGARARYQVSTLQASLADVTWPVARPGRLDVRSSVPGGGRLELSGRLRPPPAASQLRLRLARVDLLPWAQLVPGALHVEGFAEADLRIDEPLAPAAPSHVRGLVAVNQVGVGATGADSLRAARIEARGLEVEWPRRVAVRQIVVTRPRGAVERDQSGAVMVPGAPPRGEAEAAAARPSGETGAPALAADEVIVRDGRLAWRDRSVEPAVTLDLEAVNARITGVGWPMRGPLRLQVDMRPPGGGRAEFDGRVDLEPVALEGRARAQGAAVGPYVAYAALPARIGGRVDFDLAVAMAPGSEPRVTARGDVAASALDVRDEERTLLRVERAGATGVHVDWPRRATIRQLTLQRPWMLLERDRDNTLSLRTLLTPRPARRSAASPSRERSEPADSPPVIIAIRDLAIEDGGIRAVDQRVTPPFALDTRGLTGRVRGVSTDPAAPPAEFDLSGRAGGEAQLAARGRVGPITGPLRLDVAAELHDFALPRTNPYLLQQVAWEARSGSLTTSVRCRIDRDALDAKTDILVRRLELVRATGTDQAQARVGLPLGTIVALMKDRRGDIRVAVPVGGRLSDPRFDVSEAIWSTLRNVAVKTITAPLSWIGRVHTEGDSKIQHVDVEPVRFPPGSATLTPDGREQVARLAAFLAQVPDIRLSLTPMLSAGDRAAVDGSAGLPALGRRRLEAVREGITEAGGDGDRLKAAAPAESPSQEGAIQVALLDPEPRDRPGLIRRLFGEGTDGRR
ncbi:MAG TPA: DUF748 domain-containing protein [Methylomirabilota bacterium]|nr:DUF748 domain-containing protein [Methylomirabilota bacterium]